MPLYAMICVDHKGSLELRQKSRDEHLAYLRTQGGLVRVGGALLDEHGQPEGSLLILECESQAAAEALADADPYAKAGLFSSVSIRPWRTPSASWPDPDGGRSKMSAPAPGARLCALAELADPGGKGFAFHDGDERFAGFVVRKGDRVFGYIDRCPHAGWPLALWPDQYLTREGDLILCAGHGALFRPEDGLCVGGPCGGKRLTPWPVVVEDGLVRAA